MSRLLSLAAGTMLDVGPARGVEVAAATGFDAVGIWFDPDTWTSATTAAVADRLRATGVVALDMEPVILGREREPGDALIETAAELGVRHVLVAGGTADHAAVVDRFGALCDQALRAEIVVVLEFLPIFTVASLDEARRIVEAAARTNGGVLVDTLHLSRSGGSPSDLADVPKALLPYLQIADAPREPPGPTHDELRDEALHGRLLPGEGALPLVDTLRAVPSVPLSLEVRSEPLMAAYPDPVDRARCVLAATERLVEAAGER
jgi:sugar phosphate isomerase/epimerase